MLLVAATRPFDQVEQHAGVGERQRRATFLPKVWEQLPEPERFLGQLMIKAGLPARHWSPTVRFERYGSVDFGGD